IKPTATTMTIMKTIRIRLFQTLDDNRYQTDACPSPSSRNKEAPTKRSRCALVLTAVALLCVTTTRAVAAKGSTTATLLASGLQGPIGSAVGPDGALYVPEGAVGRVSRVDLTTGAVTTFASGLPLGIFGASDIAFLDDTAYVLVTTVSPDVGGNSVDGIY